MHLVVELFLCAVQRLNESCLSKHLFALFLHSGFLLLAEVTNKYADIDNSVLLEKC